MKNKELMGKFEGIERYVLVAEACRILGVCRQTLYNWHKNGRLVPEVHPITKIRMYDKRDLDTFLLDKK